VLAKGQGNFETLDGTPGEIFFLLKAKCPEVAAELKVSEGAQVFLRKRRTDECRTSNVERPTSKCL
jgi:uncharacterized protein with ATP-grasp and redox domains